MDFDNATEKAQSARIVGLVEKMNSPGREVGLVARRRRAVAARDGGEIGIAHLD